MTPSMEATRWGCARCDRHFSGVRIILVVGCVADIRSESCVADIGFEILFQRGGMSVCCGGVESVWAFRRDP